MPAFPSVFRLATPLDIGANIGLYTAQFANLVGASGLVVAFEPSKVNFLRLAHTCRLLRNVELQPLAWEKSMETSASSKELTILAQQAESVKQASQARLLKFELVMI